MRIARWQSTVAGRESPVVERVEASIDREGFVIDDRVVPFPDGLTVAEVLARGLDAAHALFER